MADEEKVDDGEEMVAQPYTQYGESLRQNQEEFGEQTPIDRRKALELLTARLPKTNVYNHLIQPSGGELSFNSDSRDGFWGSGQSTTAGAPNRAVIARKILAAIPDEMLTEEMLTQGDIRPFMLKVIVETDPNKGGKVGNENITLQDRAVISFIMQDETEKVRTETEFALTSLIDPTLPDAAERLEAAKTTAHNYSMEYRDGVINRVGQYAMKDGKFVDEETTKLSAAEQFRQDNPELTTGQTPTRFLAGQQLQDMLRSDQISFDDMVGMQDRPILRKDEFGNPISVDKIDAARVVYSDESIPVERSGPYDPTIPVRKDWYSLTEIMQKPFSMSREEALAIDQKMKRAGIYAVIGREPTLEGDPTDPAFQAAWQQLATMSLETGTPMTSILEERESAYQASLEASLAVSLTDPARLRLNGNAVARDVIGRKLSDEESQAMIKFLHDLERQNARVSAGLEATATGEPIEGVDELDEGIVADIDARMQEFVRNQNPGLAGAHDIADQYETFTSLLGGPGRGVS